MASFVACGGRHALASCRRAVAILIPPRNRRREDLAVGNHGDARRFLLHAVRVGTEPTGVAVNQRTGTVYVTNFNDGTVSVITN